MRVFRRKQMGKEKAIETEFDSAVPNAGKDTGATQTHRGAPAFGARRQDVAPPHRLVVGYSSSGNGYCQNTL